MVTACNEKQEMSGEAMPGEQIACSLAPTADFKPECTVERSVSPDGTILTLRHPDGGFRRLLVTQDGQGVTAADGAEPAEVRMSGDKEIEIGLGGNRYRLPARPKTSAPKAP